MSDLKNILSSNYFEFYGIPVSFLSHEKEIKAKYYEFSKKYHPDYFAMDEAKQSEALEISTLNNKVFKTLSSFYLRLKYILEINNLYSEDEKYVLPKEFLMEMMDLNESLMDLQMDFDAGKLEDVKSQVVNKESELEQRIKSEAGAFDRSGDLNFNLLEIKDLYFKLKYILRLKDTISTFAIS